MIRYEEQKGAFVKHCPCTPEVVPCGYYNINLHTGCPFRCSYCILQAYLETAEPVFFTNLEDMDRELAEASETQKYLRIGTGELSDSLALDGETGYSGKVLSIVEKYPEVVFEFKTKSARVEELLSYGKVLKNVVIAWSLNPQSVIEREELLTPPLKERLEALKEVQARGYKVAIHFDPLVIFDGWKEAYEGLVSEISKVLEVSRVAWWSLGALRFPYSMREYIFKHKQSRLFEGELVKGHDGKYRYFKPLRLELFRFVRDAVYRLISPEAPLYLCMEDIEVWREIFPNLTPTEESVNRYLYESAMH